MTRRRIRFPRQRAWAIALAAVTIATAGIVLLHGPGYAAPIPPTGTTTTAGTSGDWLTFTGPGLSGRASFDRSSVLSNGLRVVSAELRLNADAGTADAQRRPLAIAIVLDTSGSMAGEKIQQARLAVQEMVGRMDDQDYVSIVTYDQNARMLTPLVPVSSLKGSLATLTGYIHAAGGTNIPSGLTMGAQTLTDAPAHLVRRVVLISDGLDGSGQPIPTVAAGVQARANGGMTLSALGIGTDYSEPFLTQVAEAGRGNYEFLARGAELSGFLRRELDEASRTIVDNVVAELTLPAGWSAQQAFGAPLSSTTGTIRLPIGSLHPGAERSVIVRIQVPAGVAGALGSLPIHVRYNTTADRESHQLAGGALALTATDDEAVAASSIKPEVYAQTESAVIDARQAVAVDAWRRGDREEASRLARENRGALRQVQAAAPSPAVREQLDDLAADEAAFGGSSMSAEGRAHGLRSNSQRYRRARY